MNKSILLITLVVILGIGGYFVFNKSKSTTTPATLSTPVTKNTVVIKNFSFSPATLTVKVGETVNWVNQDLSGHSATSDSTTFDTGVFDSGSTKSVTFDKSGTFTYHCTVHPNMKGTIIVE